MANKLSHDTALHLSMTLTEQLPILQVVLPLFAAPILIFIGRQNFSWAIAFFASLTSLLISASLLKIVLTGSDISYHLGGWAPPLGIEYRIDATNAFVLFLISVISSMVLLYCRRSLKAEVPEEQHPLFYALFLLCLAGSLGVVVTGDAFNIFVFLEISSLSTYALIAQGAYRDKRALTASYTYLIMGTVGATFFVIGIGYLYIATGTLNLADLSERIAEQRDNKTVRAAFAFILVGMGLKAAMYPLHLWLPNAYTFAPSPVSAFLAGTATKMALYVLLRFMFTVFKPEFLSELHILETIILPLALLAMFVASIKACFQSDIKRMLAYSSVAQLGYMLLGITFMNHLGLTASIIHLFNHGLTKATMFMGVGCFLLSTGSTSYDKLGGLGKSMPWTSAAMVIGGLSLVGIPGTAGFLSKWLLVQAAFDKGWWILAFLIVVSSLLAIAYIWRMIEILYLMPLAKNTKANEAHASMVIPLFIMAIGCIYFGFDTRITYWASETAAYGLLSGQTGLKVD